MCVECGCQVAEEPEAPDAEGSDVEQTPAAPAER